jgi:hypothetical protein
VQVLLLHQFSTWDRGLTALPEFSLCLFSFCRGRIIPELGRTRPRQRLQYRQHARRSLFGQCVRRAPGLGGLRRARITRNTALVVAALWDRLRHGNLL